MFSTLVSAWQKSAPRGARRPARSRLTLESLERRDTPSGGHNTFPQHSADPAGAPEVSKAAHVNQGLAAGDQQNGYPLPPTGGPTRLAPGDVLTAPIEVLVPLTGTTGDLNVVSTPVVTV